MQHANMVYPIALISLCVLAVAMRAVARWHQERARHQERTDAEPYACQEAAPIISSSVGQHRPWWDSFRAA